MKNKMRILSALLMLVMIFVTVGCATEAKGVWADATYTADTTLGTGEKCITVVVGAEDKNVTFTINTNCDTLGAALLEVGLAEGEQSQYGLYIKKVNGILADCDVDMYYWSISKSGVTLMTGADGESIVGGESYELVRAK